VAGEGGIGGEKGTRRRNGQKDGRMRLKQAKRKKCAERRVNKIFRKSGARGVWSWMPGVSAPSGGLEPPSEPRKENKRGMGGNGGERG